MTQRPTPPTDLHTHTESHTPIALSDARYGGTGALPGARTPAGSTHPLGRASGDVYAFQIASKGAHFRVELLRVTASFFGRVRREYAGVTDGPFDTRAEAEAALTRRWAHYRRATEPSRSME